MIKAEEALKMSNSPTDRLSMYIKHIEDDIKNSCNNKHTTVTKKYSGMSTLMLESIRNILEDNGFWTTWDMSSHVVVLKVGWSPIEKGIL